MQKLKENRKVEQIGEEKAQSNDWERVGKSEGERGKKGSLKTRHKKLKFSGKLKSHTNRTLTPLVRTRHVATMSE